MKIAFIPMIAALCILTAAAENVTSIESSSISENAESYLADKVWECSSYVRAFNTDIRLYSRDIYYADKSYDSQPTISFEAPSSYRSVITLDNAVKGVWSVENATFIAGTLNGSKRDEMPIIELTNNRFVTKTSSGLERVCKAKTMRFNPEVLVANSWKCTLDEEFDEPNTYIKMESINKYTSNGTSEVDAIIKLKLDSQKPELSYSISYDEEWSYENGLFKTKTGAVKIKNIADNDDMQRALEEMASLESVFKNGAVDDMEIVLFDDDLFILQDLASLGEDRSKYSCKKVIDAR